MRCRSVLTRVDAHRTGELVRDETERLEQHLERCPSCRESRLDVDELAVAVKSLVLGPARSCRDSIRKEICDSVGLVETESCHVRVAFSGKTVRMIDASPGSVDAFRETYARRMGRELVEEEVPEAIRSALLDAIEGRTTRRPPIDLSGVSDFERSVLETLKGIPKGEVRSYEWVAAKVGKPRAARAVGNALANNPVPLLLPCHRVLPATGAVGRYVFGSAMKRSLLEAEGVPLGELESLGRSGIRFIGSSTTKIFCVPTCRDAKRIRETNRVPFHDANEAFRAGFRACKHCAPVAGRA